MMKAEFIGTCVENPFNDLITLEYVIDEAEEISRGGFLRKCNVPVEIKKDMMKYKWSFRYYKQDDIYFYTRSAIEHFFTANNYYKCL